MLLVWLPCPQHYRRPRFPQGSSYWPLLAVPAIGRCWRSDRTPGRSDRHPRRSDRLPPRHPVVGRLTNIHRALRGTDDSTRASRGPDVHDSTRASRSSSIPASLMSPSNCVRATNTSSTSEVAASEGCTGGTSSQPSSDYHMSEAGLLTAGQQTHVVSLLIVATLPSAHLCSHRPHRPMLVPCHGGRICCFDHQQHLGSCFSSCWLQRCHR
jgi:hypothetical protein